MSAYAIEERFWLVGTERYGMGKISVEAIHGKELIDFFSFFHPISPKLGNAFTYRPRAHLGTAPFFFMGTELIYI